MRTKQWEEILSPEEVGLPNGMAWDMKKQTMYFVDTYSSTIWEFRCDKLLCYTQCMSAEGQLWVPCTVPIAQPTETDAAYLSQEVVGLLTHHTTQLLPVTASCIVSMKDPLCRTDKQGVPIKGESGKYERREVVKVPQEEGIPDGMTIDRCAISCLMVSSSSESWLRGFLNAKELSDQLMRTCEGRSMP